MRKNAWVAGAPSRTPLGELTDSQTPSWILGEGREVKGWGGKEGQGWGGRGKGRTEGRGGYGEEREGMRKEGEGRTEKGRKRKGPTRKNLSNPTLV